MKHIAKRKVAWIGTTTLLALLLALASQGAAAQPQPHQEGPAALAGSGVLAPSRTLISYQGTLTDETGDPINATVTMKFALYDASSGGNLEWPGETQSVQVTNGLFNVVLGSVTAIDPEDLGGDRWLDIKVNNEQLTPRELLTSVAYAVQAGVVPDGSITTAKLNVSGSIDMHSWGLNNLVGIQAPSSGGFTLLYMQDNDLHIKAGAAGGGVYVGWWGNPIPLSVNGNGVFTGRGFFEGATYPEGALNVQDIGVPLSFKESDQSGPGSLWRMVLDATNARFDSSDNGTDFSAFHTPLTMYPNGTVGCGALTENNLQTPAERAAGGSDRFEEGDVLCWGVDRLELCTAPNDRLVQAVADSSGRPIVIGAEVVKVLGPVKRGDILVASSVPGYAMVNNDPTTGSVIAQALEDFDGERGIIRAMIRKF